MSPEKYSKGFGVGAYAHGRVDTFVEWRHQGHADAVGSGVDTAGIPGQEASRQHGDVLLAEQSTGKVRVGDRRLSPQIEGRLGFAYGQGDIMNDNVVVLETTQGVIEVQLYPNFAPLACENFMELVKKGYYDGIIFHRVIKDVMIQGGDPTGTGRGGSSIWGKPFADECSSDLKFDRPGLLAMANAGPNTNGSQFFITTKATPWLNMRHTIFGIVISGYNVVEKIESVPKDSIDRPLEEQKIIKAYLK